MLKKRLVIDLELLYDKWVREWSERVHNNTRPSLEDERLLIQELKKLITDHIGVDVVNMEGYLK